MTTHLIEINDSKGDLIDVLYFCSAGCYNDARKALPNEEECPGGPSPCAASGHDYDVFCEVCGVLLHRDPEAGPCPVGNLDCEQGPTTVNLIGVPKEERCGCGLLLRKETLIHA